MIGASLSLIAAALAVQGPSSAQANEILAKAGEAYSSTVTLQAEFVQKIEIPALEQKRQGRGMVYQKKPNYFLMRFDDPPGDMVVADGQFFWLYYPSAQPDQVIKTTIERGGNSPGFGSQFVQHPSSRYAATYISREKLDGRTVHLLSLVPKFDAPYILVRVWIDATDYLVRKFEVYEENDTVRTIQLINLQAGLDLPDELFQFSLPEGVEVFSR